MCVRTCKRHIRVQWQFERPSLDWKYFWMLNILCFIDENQFEWRDEGYNWTGLYVANIFGIRSKANSRYSTLHKLNNKYHLFWKIVWNHSSNLMQRFLENERRLKDHNGTRTKYWYRVFPYFNTHVNTWEWLI